MKKFLTFVVASIFITTPLFSLTNIASAATKNIQINSNIEARVVFGDQIENGDEVIGDEFMVTSAGASGNVDEQKLVYVSVEPDIFANVKLTAVKINNVPQTITYPTGRNVYTLTEASSYVIDITGATSVAYNINWSNPGFTDPNTPNDVRILNGDAKVVKVYDNATDMNDISNTIACVANGCVDNTTKEGSIHFEKGNVIVFEFVPKYGYQLTNVEMNGTALTAQSNTNQYILDTSSATGNGHFSATFTKIDDVVKTNSSAVSGGQLNLSGAIDAGTGRLSVDDFTPTEEQTTNFEETATGYEIAEYFDLSLQQIFYKGANDDSNVWTNDLSQLAGDAKISLVLAEGVDGNDVAIVHEKHDGSYELIDGTYDATTHTVSFATDSFSNYAVAYRTVAKAPDTGAINNSKDTTLASTILILGVAVTLYSTAQAYHKAKK